MSSSRSTPKTVYPLATNKGEFIPLDVAMPITGYVFTLTAEYTEFEEPLPEALHLINVMLEDFGYLYVESISEPGQYIEFALVPGVLYDLALPPMPGGCKVFISGDKVGVFRGVFNIIQRWTQLDNQTFGVS